MFAWPKRAAAVSYVVTFYRGGRKVLERRTKKTRFALPGDFRFTTGDYRWTVVPVFSPPRSVRPIVDSKFSVAR